MRRSGVAGRGFAACCFLVLAAGAIGCGRDGTSTGEGRAAEFSSVELRSDRPGLRLRAVEVNVHERYCDWSIPLQAVGSGGYAGEVVVTVSYRSRGELKTARFGASLDLAPDEVMRVRGMTRPGAAVDAIEWVDVRYVAPLPSRSGTPRPIQ